MKKFLSEVKFCEFDEAGAVEKNGLSLKPYAFISKLSLSASP